MTIHPKIRIPGKRALLVCLSLAIIASVLTSGSATASLGASTASSDDGQHDFDWEFGTWRTEVQVLADPLSDTPDEWLTFTGTSVVRPLVDRRANVVELKVAGPAGRIDGINLRLHEPQAARWSSTFASLRDGLLTPSVHGGFHDGVGEFYGDDQLAGQPIRVRFVITREGPDRARFEQAFSADDGNTWETNWIAVDTRIRGGQ
jgi:hypothetical protein